MVNRSDIETFWTRGDIHSRIHKAMSEAGLNDKKLEIEDLFPLDQYHARGIAATTEQLINLILLKIQLSLT